MRVFVAVHIVPARASVLCVCVLCVRGRTCKPECAHADRHGRTGKGFCAHARAHSPTPPPFLLWPARVPPHAVYMHIGNGIHCSDTVLVCMCDVMGHGVGVRVMANFVFAFFASSLSALLRCVRPQPRNLRLWANRPFDDTVKTEGVPNTPAPLPIYGVERRVKAKKLSWADGLTDGQGSCRVLHCCKCLLCACASVCVHAPALP